MKQAIDRKFKILAVNPCTGKFYTEEDGFFICAHDATASRAIEAMIIEGEKIGAGEEHIESLRLLMQRVIDRNKESGKKVPDTDTDCEIRRCIGGEGL